MAQIAKLLNILGASRSPVLKRPWSEVEEVLGISLPSDYKEWGDVYASISLGNAVSVHNYRCLEGNFKSEIEGILSVLQSGVEFEGIDRIFDADGNRLESAPEEWSFYPSVPGLLGWGYTVNGNSLMWYTEGDPDEWKVVLGSRDLDLHVFDCGFTGFLIRLVENDLGPRLDSSRWMTSLSPKEMWGYKTITVEGREFRAIDFRPME